MTTQRQMKRTKQKAQKKEFDKLMRGKSKELIEAVSKDIGIPVKHIDRVFLLNDKVHITFTEEGQRLMSERQA